MQFHVMKVMTLLFIWLAFLGPHSDAYGRPNKAWGEVNHVILFIGDGMHLEHEIATSRYLYGTDYHLVWHKFPYQTSVATWDVTTYNEYGSQLDRPVTYDDKRILPWVGYDQTKGGKRPYPLQRNGINDGYFLAKISGKEPATDSASAATAWATGFKTDVGNIAWLPSDPDQGGLKTIAEILRDERGFAIGVVSTVPYAHATAASHVSHNKHRNNYDQIAEEIMGVTKPEVVIGGGHGEHSRGNSGHMSSALLEAVKATPEYVVVERQEGVDGGSALLRAADDAAARGSKLFGLFGGPGGNFESPVPSDTPGSPKVDRATIENPLLKDAVLAALKVLSKDPDGFFAMFEQGDMDWANHDNDFHRMIGTAWDLHEAVQTAMEFVNRPDDDIHWFNTLLIVTSDHGNGYLRLMKKLGSGDLPDQKATASSPCPPGAYCGKVIYPDGEVTYRTVNHTNELVRLYAFGKGAHLFRQYEGAWYPCTRIIDNTHIFNVIAEAVGVPQRSPLEIKMDEPSLCNDAVR